MGPGKSIKVRELPEDQARTVTIGVKSAGLTTAEEIVFRTRHGVPLAPEERLEFRETNNNFIRHRLNDLENRVHDFHRRNRGRRN